MPWKTLCGFPPVTDTVSLLVPNGRWRPDTVITDVDGNEIFVIIEQTNEMRSYEVVIGDLDGRRLVCVKRHLVKAFWRDGFYFCTYRPNYPGQKALTDRDIDNKKVYPFSYLEIEPLKGNFMYRHFDAFEQLKKPRMISANPWFGFMSVCCTPLMRFGNFSTRFRSTKTNKWCMTIDQWKNIVKVGPGQDLLSALCIAYVFDRVQGQPLITVVGRDEDEELEDDDASIESEEDLQMHDTSNKNKQVEMTNMPIDNDDDAQSRRSRRSQYSTSNAKYSDVPTNAPDEANNGGYRDDDDDRIPMAHDPYSQNDRYYDQTGDDQDQYDDNRSQRQQQQSQQQSQQQPQSQQGDPNAHNSGYVDDDEPIFDPYATTPPPSQQQQQSAQQQAPPAASRQDDDRPELV